LADLHDWASVPGINEVLASLPETIVAIDDNLRLRAVNRTYSPVFQRTPASGDRLEEIFGGKAASLIAGMVDTAQRTGAAHAELDTGADLFQITAQRLGSAPLTLLALRNVTGRRHTERALIDLIQDKSSFLTAVSHELRTPLTAVLGYAQLLAEPDPNLDEAVRTAMVHDMTDQAWDLAGIVEDLLAVGRIEIGDLRVVSVPVNLAGNVAQVIESMGSQGSRIILKGDRSVTGVGDPARFRQVVRNLLSNALTHGAEPVTVEITAHDSNAALRIKDQGPGVPENLAESIFDQYSTGTNTATPGRVGIGLWISKELTSLMGGQLTYHREPGETVFQVAIPRVTRTG